jgi:hypothetical protein
VTSARNGRRFFIRQDLSFDLLLEVSRHAPIEQKSPTLSTTRIAELCDRQRTLYDKAAGIIALSGVSPVPGGEVGAGQNDKRDKVPSDLLDDFD